MNSKTCLKRPLKRGPKLVFKTDYHLMQVKSISECILQYSLSALSYTSTKRFEVWLTDCNCKCIEWIEGHYLEVVVEVYHLSLRPLFCLFLATFKTGFTGSTTCVKWPLQNRQNKYLIDKWQLNEGQKYCRMLPFTVCKSTCLVVYHIQINS